MKRVLPTLLLGILTGCSQLIGIAVVGVPAFSDYVKTNYELNQPMEADVGSTMIVVETGRKNDVHGYVHDGVQQQLIYGGSADDVVKIAYREFFIVADVAEARPAVAQELQYDLKQSRIIAFRRTKLEVLAAAKDRIAYKVIESPVEKTTTVPPTPRSPAVGLTRCQVEADCDSVHGICFEGFCRR